MCIRDRLSSEPPVPQLFVLKRTDSRPISPPHQVIMGKNPELLARLNDTLFIDDISMKKHTVKALEYLSSQIDNAHELVLQHNGFTSGILDAAKTAGKEAIQLSALQTLSSVANHLDLQVELAHTKGLIDHLVMLLDSDSEDARSLAKDILTCLSENEDLQNIIE
eukprot:TRINITY_DN12780_c0_g1_i2.p1 TRINITY_DN12780_c0_g1~~TRINITY_DN12780_c0_g1_i2.p1  ORF type:complete len:165 (-),score=55.19 TRINITY_DN12780_c0_g1_i2:200-694(-)